MKFSHSRGFPLPYGATKHSKGINFSLFSKHATAVSLCLFEPEAPTPSLEIPLDSKTNKTGDVWHIFVYDLSEQYGYGYRIDGPYDPLEGDLYNSRCIVLDPYAKMRLSTKQWGDKDGHPHIEKAEIFPLEPFNWEDDDHPNIPLKDLIIYEMHVRGFTQDSSSKVTHPGTFRGIIEKIPHLKALGVNAIELMPVHEFNENENYRKNPKTGERLYNYWGYSSVSFFSLMRRYSGEGTNWISEFKSLVKELHKNGIEVILDVVFNHTAEGNAEGPIISFKGIENSIYYMLGPNGEYYNFSGCGNTVNANHPVVRELIRDSLRYFVQEMHVDGFRFDLASILVRSHEGVPLQVPPLVEAIAYDPVLADTKLIAEAWDAAGLYQVGTFPSFGVWSEWNGKYRDAVRRFIKGTDGEVGYFATRLAGSEDLYGKGRAPYHSINFITAHDGFTLRDLVSYNEKHNEENGEYNKDGSDQNDSWNCGVEGETTDSTIQSLRERQIKNFLLALLASQGTPMLLMGDEYGHTKHGNNNTWCQDSKINWFDWDLLEKNQGLFRFVSKLIAFRKSHSLLTHAKFLTKDDVTWHGTEPSNPDWTPSSHFIAYTLKCREGTDPLYLAFNASHEPATVTLPPTPKEYHQIVNTSLPPPQDFLDEPLKLHKTPFKMPPYSALLLKIK